MLWHDFYTLVLWESAVNCNVFSLTVNTGALVQNNYGSSGMIGGYHPGDAHFFGTDPQWELEVVPEPSALAGLITGLGGLTAIFARRKRA